MDIKIFYKNQTEVAKGINNLIDDYWNEKIDEKILIQSIVKIVNNNKAKIYKNDRYTKIILQRCGKKRLEIVDAIVSNIRREEVNENII